MRTDAGSVESDAEATGAVAVSGFVVMRRRGMPFTCTSNQSELALRPHDRKTVTVPYRVRQGLQGRGPIKLVSLLAADRSLPGTILDPVGGTGIGLPFRFDRPDLSRPLHPPGSVVSNDVANLIASKFIARPDVKAVQYGDGSWSPHTDTGKRDGNRLPWKRQDLLAHLDGQRTYGHYLLSPDSDCKLFAFDVDLEKSGTLPLDRDEATGDWKNFMEFEDLRGAWATRSHPARPYMKAQFKEIAHKLLRGIYENLGIPCAAAYSGGKGIHVYGFTGKMPARDVRDGAIIVLEALGGFTPTKGENFYAHEKWPNLSIEVFPKQSNLDGKDLGNLMRLPLGRNLKSTDPTFFIDMTTEMAAMKPVDPVWALTAPSPWARPGE